MLVYYFCWSNEISVFAIQLQWIAIAVQFIASFLRPYYVLTCFICKKCLWVGGW